MSDAISFAEDLRWMTLALQEARLAAEQGEVPVGAVIVQQGVLLAKDHNRREQHQSALSHAEVLTIGHACHTRSQWRVSGCTLYVTLEPCPMCAGAILNARIDRVVFGAFEEKGGCCGSLLALFDQPWLHQPRYLGGVCAAESTSLLQQFFAQRRNSPHV